MPLSKERVTTWFKIRRHSERSGDERKPLEKPLYYNMVRLKRYERWKLVWDEVGKFFPTEGKAISAMKKYKYNDYHFSTKDSLESYEIVQYDVIEMKVGEISEKSEED